MLNLTNGWIRGQPGGCLARCNTLVTMMRSATIRTSGGLLSGPLRKSDFSRIADFRPVVAHRRGGLFHETLQRFNAPTLQRSPAPRRLACHLCRPSATLARWLAKQMQAQATALMILSAWR